MRREIQPLSDTLLLQNGSILTILYLLIKVSLACSVTLLSLTNFITYEILHCQDWYPPNRFFKQLHHWSSCINYYCFCHQYLNLVNLLPTNFLPVQEVAAQDFLLILHTTRQKLNYYIWFVLIFFILKISLPVLT